MRRRQSSRLSSSTVAADRAMIVLPPTALTRMSMRPRSRATPATTSLTCARSSASAIEAARFPRRFDPMATYVLIHGAYQGGWIWKPVATQLRAAGHQVYAPTLDGCAERRHAIRPGITVTTHAEEIAQLLFYED